MLEFRLGKREKSERIRYNTGGIQREFLAGKHFKKASALALLLKSVHTKVIGNNADAVLLLLLHIQCS